MPRVPDQPPAGLHQTVFAGFTPPGTVLLPATPRLLDEKLFLNRYPEVGRYSDRPAERGLFSNFRPTGGDLG